MRRHLFHWPKSIIEYNNLRDIKYYVDKFSLKHITTGDILVKAYEDKLITEEQVISFGQKCCLREGE